MARPCERRGAEGFYSVARGSDGRWWLLDPAGAQVFLRAVHGVRPPLPPPDGGRVIEPVVRLREWEFNALGVGADDVAVSGGLPYVGSVDFCAVGPVVTGPRLRLPDVFTPDWPRSAAQWAVERCRPEAGQTALLGWVTDDALAWAQPEAGWNGPTLLQLCLSLEPSFAAYHAAWEFVLALHGGRIEGLARAWGVELPNKESVRELTRAGRGIATRGYAKDEAQWTREWARRYFAGTANAVRTADPAHLLFGPRHAGWVGPVVLAEASYPQVDVALTPWQELGTLARPGLQPVLADGVGWSDPAFRAPGGVRERGLTSVERMLRRARVALTRLALHPSVVGYVWAQWQDLPGEQPPFGSGLVHRDDAPALEHTEILAEFNRRRAQLRAG